MCGKEVGSYTPAKEDGTITGPSQAPLYLGYTVVLAQFPDVLSKYVVFAIFYMHFSD
jgi:hypothetical protein